MAFAAATTTMCLMTSCSDNDPMEPTGKTTTTNVQNLNGKVFTNEMQRSVNSKQGSAIVIYGSRAAVTSYTDGQALSQLSQNATVVYNNDKGTSGYFKLDNGQQLDFQCTGNAFLVTNMPGATNVGNNKLCCLTLKEKVLTSRSVDDDNKVVAETGAKLLTTLSSKIPVVGETLVSPLLEIILGKCIEGKWEKPDPVEEVDNKLKAVQQQLNDANDARIEDRGMDAYKQFNQDYLIDMADEVNGIYTNMKSTLALQKAGTDEKDLHTQNIRDFNMNHAAKLRSKIEKLMEKYADGSNCFRAIDQYAFYAYPFESNGYTFRDYKRVQLASIVSKTILLLNLNCSGCKALGMAPTVSSDKVSQLANDFKEFYLSKGGFERHDEVVCNIKGAWFIADKDLVRYDVKSLPSVMTGNAVNYAHWINWFTKDNERMRDRAANKGWKDICKAAGGDNGVLRENECEALKSVVKGKTFEQVLFENAGFNKPATYSKESSKYLILNNGLKLCDSNYALQFNKVAEMQDGGKLCSPFVGDINTKYDSRDYTHLKTTWKMYYQENNGFYTVKVKEHFNTASDALKAYLDFKTNMDTDEGTDEK